MSAENLHRTTKGIETPIANESVLKQNFSNDIKPKRTCIKNLNKRLNESQKKDKIKNTIILCTIFFSIGALGFIVG